LPFAFVAVDESVVVDVSKASSAENALSSDFAERRAGLMFSSERVVLIGNF
jgi:hypothetical protein